MIVPGFAAEAALGQPSGHYRTAGIPRDPAVSPKSQSRS